jgi:hypothetical protein
LVKEKNADFNFFLTISGGGKRRAKEVGIGQRIGGGRRGLAPKNNFLLG